MKPCISLLQVLDYVKGGRLAGLLGISPGAIAQPVVLPPLPIGNVGDIAHDSVTDRASFPRCGGYDAPQYYQVQTSYAGGMPAIRQRLLAQAPACAPAVATG